MNRNSLEREENLLAGLPEDASRRRQALLFYDLKLIPFIRTEERLSKEGLKGLINEYRQAHSGADFDESTLQEVADLRVRGKRVRPEDREIYLKAKTFLNRVTGFERVEPKF